MLMQVQANKPRKPWRPLIAVDFDGVLHDYDGRWSPGLVRGAAIEGAMRWLGYLYLDGNCDVAITSARSRYLMGRWGMKRWLRQHLIFEFGYQAGPNSYDPLALDIFEWIKWPWFKPGALIYLDDRAVCFNGPECWPLVEDVLKFRPWNKKFL